MTQDDLRDKIKAGLDYALPRASVMDDFFRARVAEGIAYGLMQAMPELAQVAGGQPGTQVQLQSPNGTVYAVTVADDGHLITAKVG